VVGGGGRKSAGVEDGTGIFDGHASFVGIVNRPKPAQCLAVTQSDGERLIRTAAAIDPLQNDARGMRTRLPRNLPILPGGIVDRMGCD
jgi:hypothetical protein